MLQFPNALSVSSNLNMVVGFPVLTISIICRSRKHLSNCKSRTLHSFSWTFCCRSSSPFIVVGCETFRVFLVVADDDDDDDDVILVAAVVVVVVTMVIVSLLEEED